MNLFKSVIDGKTKPNVFNVHRYLDSGNGYSVTFDAASYEIKQHAIRGKVCVVAKDQSESWYYPFAVIYRVRPTLWSVDKFIVDLKEKIKSHTVSALMGTGYAFDYVAISMVDEQTIAKDIESCK